MKFANCFWYILSPESSKYGLKFKQFAWKVNLEIEMKKYHSKYKEVTYTTLEVEHTVGNPDSIVPGLSKTVREKPPTYSLEVWQSWSKHALASIVVGLNCSQKIQSGTFCFLWAWIECILVIRPSCRNQSVTTAGREQHPARSFTREPSLCLSRQMYKPFVYSLKKKMFLF